MFPTHLLSRRPLGRSRIFSRMFSSLALTAALAACGAGPTGPDASPPMEIQPAATLAVIPAAVTLRTGAGVRFDFDLRDAGGRSRPGPVTWSAAGGTIDDTGFYLAGSVAGTFPVTASVAERTASATVTIEASDTSPSPRDLPPADRVEIRPGESIQAAVDAHPAGTTFLIRAGLHRRQRVEPKDDMVFVGEPGAILDGGGITDFAFRGTARNVTIRGLVIERYAPGPQMGAIKAGDHDATGNSTGWVAEDNEIRYNDGGGVRIGHRTTLRNNHIHHNEQIGVVGVGDDVLVEGNEIAWNNWNRAYDYGWEAGGTKFVKTRDLVVRNNHVHDNWGPGLWTDTDNIDTLYEANRVENNADTGIFHEISYRATIRNNIVRGNGFDRVGDWAYGAGILVAHSPDVEVYGNVVEDNQNGIMGIQQSRGSGAYGPHDLRNLSVYENVVVQRSKHWAAGVAQDIGDKGVFSRNLSFDRNRYALGSAGGRWFAWDNGEKTKDQWQRYGLDRGGTFTW